MLLTKISRRPSRDDDVGRLPTFLIIGAQRAGTTSLTRYLDEHPQIYMYRAKEARFFDRHYGRGLDWYRSLFREAASGSELGEASPNYMYDEAAVPRMAEAVPNARLVAILRNPVDRAYSHYWLLRALEREPMSFAAAVRAESEPIHAGFTSPGPRSYLDRGRYLRQLQHVCRYYPRQALHVLLFEDLRQRPEETFAELCRFLGVHDCFQPTMLGRQVNSHVTFHSVRLRDSTRNLPQPLRNLIGRFNTRPAPYPPMDPGLRADLQRLFEPDNAALATWLGRDLSVWAS
ncbi:MAG: sulfotransferase domain-containing protein [Actinomycetota bacterium]|nr:sulfotransferase domain-containing protein [Actinomycetota bacterium]